MLLQNGGWDRNTGRTIAEVQPYADKTKQMYLAYKFINNAYRQRYRHVKEGLHDVYNKDYDKKEKCYPETLEATYNLLMTLQVKRMIPTKTAIVFAKRNKEKKMKSKNNWKKDKVLQLWKAWPFCQQMHRGHKRGQ